MSEIERVCVFCASSTKIDEAYVKDAERLGDILVENNIAMNYGGGAVGLMGAIANEMLLNNGDVRGIIPTFMVEVEWEHKGVKDMLHVQTMAERKRLLVDGVDAVIAMPGSTGTLEELVEVLSNKKLGLFTKPVIILNTNGFFNPLIEMLHKMADENFMRKEHTQTFSVVNSAEDVLPAILKAAPWCEDAFEIAAV